MTGRGFYRLTLATIVCLVMGLLCWTLSLAGRRFSHTPEFAVRNVKYWSLPSVGRQLPSPRGMRTLPGDDLCILDDAGRILIYSAEGKLLKQWWMPEYSIGKPEGVCRLLDGRLAIADTHYHQIVVFDADGNLLEKWGKRGTGPLEFEYPVKLTQAPDGFLYVCEYGGIERVQKLTPQGEFVLAFGQIGTEPGDFQRPSGVVWDDHKLYVVDAINCRVQVFSEEGKFERVLTDANSGLRYPYDIAIAPDKTLFVAEWGGGRLTQLNLKGEVLSRFGSTGRGERQFVTPWGITVDSKGRVTVADTGNRRCVRLE